MSALPSGLPWDPDAVAPLQDERLRATMRRVASRHPYYRDLLRERGIDPDAVRGTADLPLLPLTGKADFAAAPERFRLEPTGDPADQLWDIAYTSGSTSTPTPIYQAAYDFHAILLAQRRMAEIRGMTSADRIANLYPLTPQPHGAWTRANHAAAALGASVVCGMSGATGWFGVSRRLPEVAELVVASDPTTLWGVPSYVRRVLDEVARQGGRLPNVRMLAVSGEPCTPETADVLAGLTRDLGAREVVVSNSLGASELQCGLVECEPGGGFHNPAPELFHIEAVDDDGRPCAPGTPGRLTLTHLDRRGTVLLRYLLGDVVTVDHGRCPHCGRGGGRVVAYHHRTGSATKVRGQLLDGQVLGRTVERVPGVLEHRATVRWTVPSDPLSGDELVVAVALTAGADAREVVPAVRTAVKRACRVTPLVEVATADEIFPADERMKPRRFLDERASANR
ncbi:AMP-binding protein [Microbispora amethystogenes]|uniref:phenylacetate--CoA ligase family protein n=1 Tax=Microbispora amethystogenes TaxID=1427754 RepID=UPI0033C11465